MREIHVDHTPLDIWIVGERPLIVMAINANTQRAVGFSLVFDGDIDSGVSDAMRRSFDQDDRS